MKRLIKAYNIIFTMLKGDFHIHTKEDPKDMIKYTAKDLVKFMAKLKYEVMALTPHEKPVRIPGIKEYAKKHGILLLEGSERFIEGHDVVVIGYDGPLNKFEDLDKVNDENGLVIAPHPFYQTHTCLMGDLEPNLKRFDAIEYSHFYTWFMNFPNRKAEKLAEANGKTLVGTSDSHDLAQIGHTYTVLDADKNYDSILESIRKNRVRVVTKPLPSTLFFKIAFNHFFKKW